jgi:hypothetical protein
MVLLQDNGIVDGNSVIQLPACGGILVKITQQIDTLTFLCILCLPVFDGTCYPFNIKPAFGGADFIHSFVPLYT